MKFVIRKPGALRRRPRATQAAAVLDPRPADPDLHRRLLRPRLQRRPEGHGPDHADPDRHGADGLCPEPRRAGRAMSGASRRPRPQASQVVRSQGAPARVVGDPRPAVTAYMRSHEITGGDLPALCGR